MPIQVWGLTGYAGAGKSSAIQYLASEGYPVCDADKLSQQVLDPATPEGKTNLIHLKKILGDKALLPDGSPDRDFLRRVVAENGIGRKRFEDWIFPLIIERFEKIRQEWEKDEHQLGFIEGSRLVESGYVAKLEGLIVVTAAEEIRVKRLIQQRGMTKEAASAFLQAQRGSIAEQQAQFVWNNSSTLLELHKQIEVFLLVSDPES